MRDEYSVLLPVYAGDKAEYLNKSIASMIEQTLAPKEILILEDGPVTDEIESVVLEYERKYSDIIKVKRFPQNRGLGLTLRDGILLSECEFVARMDADDISRAERIAIEMEFLKAHPDIDMVGCVYDEFQEEGVQGKIRELPETPEKIMKFAHKRNPFGHPTILARKQAIIDAGNYRDYPLLEDYDLWIRMLQNGSKLYNLQQILVDVRGNEAFYRRRGGLDYYKAQITFFTEHRKSGFISNSQFVRSLIIRGISCMMPGAMREWMYKRILRK